VSDMSHFSGTEAFTVYMRSGVESGTPLSEAVFLEFWHALTDEDRDFWIQQFEDGPTQLTSELVANIDVTHLSPADLSRLAPSPRRR
jgi:hypothetical protein